MKEHRGVMILVFGILTFVVCPFFGVAAWVMGNSDLKEMDQGTMDPEGRGMTQAGKIIGMVGVLMSILSILAVGAMLALGVGFAAVEGGGY